MKIKGIILCEDPSDQVLVGSLMETVKQWSFIRTDNHFPFQEKSVAWYKNNNNDYFAIWSVDGCNFERAIRKIFELEKLEHSTESLLIITDHDDNTASNDRPSAIYNSIHGITPLDNYRPDDFIKNNNKWQKVSYTAGFNTKVSMNLCYLLVPLASQGALETYMLDALSENSEAKREVIEQVKQFIRGLKSQDYLRTRRQKIKAELSVSVSVFFPERMFDTLIELITQVDWSKFETTNEQFKVLTECNFF